jgi:TPR repeat protein
MLGRLYAGRGQLTEAFNWYRKAADQGDANAQYFVGADYKFGRGVPKDDAQAVVWYRKAAQQGEENAEIWLGESYIHGIGVNKRPRVTPSPLSRSIA